MSNETEQPTLSERLAEIVKASGDLESRNLMLQSELDCTMRHNAVLADDNARLRAENERLVNSDSIARRENVRLKRVLTTVGNLIADGLQQRHGLRGVPMREDEQMPKVVRMGPAGS